MTDCATLAASAKVEEVLWCAIEMGAGSYAMAAVLIFILLIYAMYKFRLPFQVQVPVGLFVLFVFAGAGVAPITPMGGVSAFTTLMWIGIMAMGAVTSLAIWRLKK